MNKEIVQMVESIAREKDLDEDLVFKAVEEALAFAAKKIIKGDPKITVELDRKTGHATVVRHWEIVKDVDLQENLDQQVLRPDAPEEFQDLDGYEEVLDIDLGRQAAQLAKQSILQKLRDIEQNTALDDVLERGEGLLYGTIKNFQRGNAIVEVGRLEALLPKANMLPNDTLKIGSRIRVAIEKIERMGGRDVVTVSRTSEKFMRLLIEQEVAAVEEGDIEIVKLVRAPGVRCKMIVKNHLKQESDRRGMQLRNNASRIIIGSNGMHAKNIAAETGGEKLDIINYSDDLAEMVTQALYPAEATRIRIDEELKTVEVSVVEAGLGLVIGQKGVNIRLISELLGWNVEVMTDEQWDTKEQDRYAKSIQLFVKELDVDEEVAQALVESGFASIEDIAFCDVSDISSIEGFEEEIAGEIQRRAMDWAKQRQAVLNSKYGPARQSLLQVEGIREEEIEQLVQVDIFSSDDLADLATDELLEILPHWRSARAQTLIMNARKLWEKEVA